MRIGQGLDGVIFPEAVQPVKCIYKILPSFADAGFIINVKRRSEMIDNLIQHR